MSTCCGRGKKIRLIKAIKPLLKNHVLYKGHHFLSYAQLFTCMSFTPFYKGHTIHVGPERASRGIRSSLLKFPHFTKELRIFPFKSSFKTHRENKISQELIPPTLIVHNIPPFEAHRWMSCNEDKNQSREENNRFTSSQQLITTKICERKQTYRWSFKNKRAKKLEISSRDAHLETKSHKNIGSDQRPRPKDLEKSYADIVDISAPDSSRSFFQQNTECLRHSYILLIQESQNSRALTSQSS